MARGKKTQKGRMNDPINLDRFILEMLIYTIVCALVTVAALVLPWAWRLKRIPNCDGSAYLTRLIILEWADGSKLMLHKFHSSDHDRDLHDHPWAFKTFILWRGYIEHHAGGSRRRYPGMLLQRPAQWRHRVELIKGKPAWTLVFTGPKVREWGYHTPAGWVSHTEWWASNCD